MTLSELNFPEITFDLSSDTLSRLEPEEFDDLLYETLSEQRFDVYAQDASDFFAEIYGDPHFVIQKGDSLLCFDQYGADQDNLTIIDDKENGLVLSGKILKTKRKRLRVI